MSNPKGAGAPVKTFDPIALSKKHRISLEDARKIIEQYGEDAKAIDKAARRIAV